jgi:uncharacterized cupin superfamily protein
MTHHHQWHINKNGTEQNNVLKGKLVLVETYIEDTDLRVGTAWVPARNILY